MPVSSPVLNSEFLTRGDVPYCHAKSIAVAVKDQLAELSLSDWSWTFANSSSCIYGSSHAPIYHPLQI
ncbi:hypothetical protein GUJ93_ZPchr0010g10849 [Zizania palustris]|uniref:Uncharacterized protein n=1 Tax=Zizania palustris TaxID=103762 RepID=A0A8J5WDK9_ZIZPA|nr:hypothetical protein GUJ93_ZPchr0010g10849 [Zizania palustris]